jgi:hypothetical protein
MEQYHANADIGRDSHGQSNVVKWVKCFTIMVGLYDATDIRRGRGTFI